MTPAPEHVSNPEMRSFHRILEERTTPINYDEFIYHKHIPDEDFDDWFSWLNTHKHACDEEGTSLMPHSREEFEFLLRLAFDSGRQTRIIRAHDQEAAGE